MNLPEAVAVWEELRAELELKVAHADDGRWPEREAALRRKLEGVAVALDVLRSPYGPLVRKRVDELVLEHQELRARLKTLVALMTDAVTGIGDLLERTKGGSA